MAPLSVSPLAIWIRAAASCVMPPNEAPASSRLNMNVMTANAIRHSCPYRQWHRVLQVGARRSGSRSVSCSSSVAYARIRS
jgi:hypothetical protein